MAQSFARCLALGSAETRSSLRDPTAELRDLLIRQVLCRNAGLLELVPNRRDGLSVLDRAADLHETRHDCRVVTGKRAVLGGLEHPAVERLGFLEAERERDLVAGARRLRLAVAGGSGVDVCELGGGGCRVLHYWRECNWGGWFCWRFFFSRCSGVLACGAGLENLLEAQAGSGRVRIDDDPRELVVAYRDDPALP